MQPVQSMGGIGTWIVVNVSESVLRNNGLLERLRVESRTSIANTDMSVIINLGMMLVLLCGLMIIVLRRAKDSILLSN